MGALPLECDVLAVRDPADLQQDDGVYARLWTFVRRQLRLRPRAASCPDERSAGASASTSAPPAGSMDARRPRYLSEDGGWSRVALLRQVELRHELEHEEERRAVATTQRARVQGTCGNCGRLFFRALAGPGAAFCGSDCRSSFQYRSAVQEVVDGRCGLLLIEPPTLPAAF